MKTSYQDDIKLLKKAKRRIMSAFIMMYAMICLFFFAAYFILNQSFLPQSEFLDMTYITATVISSVTWLVVLFVIDTGKPASKYAYYGATAAQSLFSLWLLWKVYQDPSAWLVWLIWSLLMLAESYFLFRFGHWMFHSYYGKIFFDKTLMVYENEYPETNPSSNEYRVSPAEEEYTRVYPSNPAEAASASRRPDFGSPQMNQARQADYRISSEKPYRQDEYADYGYEEEYEDEKPSVLSSIRDKAARHPWLAGIFLMDHKPLTYPRAAIRLGVIVYAEMIIFPILMEVFGFLFKSANGKFSFATSIMFTMCIISAVIWTVPMFFLYLKQHGVRYMIYAGIGIEILVSLFYFSVLKGYYLNPTEDHVYHLSVFLWFALFDAIRYAILIWAIVPILRLPKPLPGEAMDLFGNQALFSNATLPKVSIPSAHELIDKAMDKVRSSINPDEQDNETIKDSEDFRPGSGESLPDQSTLVQADESKPEPAAAAYDSKAEAGLLENMTENSVQADQISAEPEASEVIAVSDSENKPADDGLSAQNEQPVSSPELVNEAANYGSVSSQDERPKRPVLKRSRKAAPDRMQNTSIDKDPDEPVIYLPGDEGFDDLP